MLQQTSIALIRNPDRPECEWLGIWNDRRQCYEFVSAERLESESWRECLDREIAWSLQLQRGKDYLISSMARLHFEETRVSINAEADLHVVVEFYIVDPYGRRGREAFGQLRQTRWLTNNELRAGLTVDGQLIAPELTTLLQKADLIPKT